MLVCMKTVEPREFAALMCMKGPGRLYILGRLGHVGCPAFVRERVSVSNGAVHETGKCKVGRLDAGFICSCALCACGARVTRGWRHGGARVGAYL